MMETWLIEFGRSFLSLIFQPLFYWAFILTILTINRRKKKERQSFGTSIESRGSEWRKTWTLSLIASLLLSVILVITGGILSYPVLVVLSIVTILLSIAGALTFLSAAYFVSLSILILWIITPFDIAYVPESWMADWGDVSLTLLLAMAALFIVVEAILTFTTKREYGFPQLIKGKRGKYMGRHMLKRLSIIPFFVPVPVGAIESFASWWPIFPLGDSGGYGLLIFPMLIGVQQSFQGMYIDQGGKLLGKWLVLLAIITALFAAGSYYFPILAIIGAFTALFGRFIIFLSIRFFDLEKQAIFTPKPDGLLILSVIANSPAEKMGLKIGEKIEKVHQIPVTNEQEFYDALQESRTFCKLEVRTLDGELRFVQGPMYQGDHYELGLVFVKEKPRFRLYQDFKKEIE